MSPPLIKCAQCGFQWDAGMASEFCPICARRGTELVLRDFMAERGELWIAELVLQRKEIFGVLRRMETAGEEAFCPFCERRRSARDAYTVRLGSHLKRCPLGLFLRLVGGEQELQRQISASMEEAYAEDRGGRCTAPDCYAPKQFSQDYCARHLRLAAGEPFAMISAGYGRNEPT